MPSKKHRGGKRAVSRGNLYLMVWGLLSFLMEPALSQKSDVAFRHLSALDGLSQSSVISITQDKKGLMWFGTRDGLNRYDGHRFTVFKHNAADPKSISNNDIIALVTDSQGDLWVGTFNGLNKYDYRQDRFIRFQNNSEDSTSLSDNSIWAICEASNGDLWVGTAKGLNKYNRKTGAFERFLHNPQDVYSIADDYILDIHEDREGFIWIATARGLHKAMISSKGNVRFERYVHDPAKRGSLSDNFTQAIAEDAQGNLWVGTKYGGLNRFDKKRKTFTAWQHQPGQPNSISDNDVRSLAFNRQGELLIGTYMGLNLLNLQQQRFYRMLNDKDDAGSLSKNSVKSVFVDRNGTAWIGTYYGGINLLDRQNNNFRNYKYKSDLAGLSFDVVSAVIEDNNGNVYIGTEGGGINVLNPQSKTFSYIRHVKSGGALASNNIKSLYLDNKQHLWVGTFNAGLSVIDLASGAVKNYTRGQGQSDLSDNNIYAIAQENDSLYWLGTYGGGLNLFNARSGRFRTIKEGDGKNLSSNLIRTILKDGKGNLWLGTQYGINMIPAAQAMVGAGKFRHFFYNTKKKTGEDVTTLFEDSQGRVWAGTNESGLNLYDTRADKFVNYNLSEMTGSSGNIVHGILDDKAGNLWISTNQGILRLNPQSRKFKMYNEAHGLISNEFNNNSSLRTRNGQMYFGSVAGLTSFHPDSIRVNRYAPPIVLTDLKIFGQPVKAGEKDGVLSRAISVTNALELEYGQAIFTIGFALPNYINAQKNHYAYRLKGLEEKWNYTNSNSATYTIQSSGNYVFEVKGANNDDQWTAQPTVLKIKVHPAPWRTWWAFTLYGLVILVALYLLVKIILSRSKLMHELELEHVQHEKQEALNQMKLQFFTNISHEFRTPLTLVLGPLGQFIQKFKGDAAAQRQLLDIESNANRMLYLIDELMDFTKLDDRHLQLKVAENDIIGFVEAIFLSFRQYACVLNFDYKFKASEEHFNLWFDRDKLETVVFNLISNAFKYTAPGGKIEVGVQLCEQKVKISVSDTGVGIAPEHLGKIFDRFYEVNHREKLQANRYNKGTGIGLALAKGIVELHQGTINVASIKGEGSTFTVALPLGNSHIPPEQISVPEGGSAIKTDYERLVAQVDGAAKEPESAKQHSSSVLVVEDNEEVRQFIRQLLCEAHEVLEARNGKEGLEVALRESPDIIISDVMMPEMDGIAFCAQLKSNVETSHIPVILLTARTSPAYRFEGLETGADDYVSKPFNPKELQIKVRNMLHLQRSMREKFASESIIKPSDVTVTSDDERLLEKALLIVEQNISNEAFDIATFCEELGVSRTMLFTKVKAWTSLTPNEFIQAMRMKRAAQLLEQNKLNISQVGYEVGYRNPKYFSKCFQRFYSETPTAYAKKFAKPEEV